MVMKAMNAKREGQFKHTSVAGKAVMLDLQHKHGVARSGSNPESGLYPRAPESHLGSVRRSIVERAISIMGKLGKEMIPVNSHEAGGNAGWHTLMMPAAELPCWDLPDDLVQAERVTRLVSRMPGVTILVVGFQDA